MNALSIIMPCHNRAHGLRDVLDAYDRQVCDESFEIIAIDDASTDGTYETLMSYRPSRFNLRVERMEKNQGQGVARNRVIPSIQSRLTLFTGDDMLPAPSFVQGHLDAHRHYPDERIAILGRVEWASNIPQNTLMKHIDGVGAQQFSFYYLVDGREYDFRHFYTCNISLSTKFLQSLDHWFDPKFYLYGFEDVELGYRLFRRGMRILYNRKMLVYHYHYHNIWTFARRQYASGVMLQVLLAMHPELAWYIPYPLQRIAGLFFRVRDLASSSKDGSLESIAELSCRIASNYEWQDAPGLDQLYRVLLDYFYYDGLIEGLFKNILLQRRLRRVHANKYLIPAIAGFIRQNELAGNPISVYDFPNLLQSLQS